MQSIIALITHAPRAAAPMLYRAHGAVAVARWHDACTALHDAARTGADAPTWAREVRELADYCAQRARAAAMGVH